MSAVVPISETDETVTLSRGDYLALLEHVEDLRDIEAIARHRAYVASVGWQVARQNCLTGAEMMQILEGIHPVKVWRTKREMSRRELAEAAGVSLSYLCEIETGKKPGSASTLKALAAALAVPMDVLVT